eukprot:gnl/Spiro4/437_TR241_c0_g1_i1.p1 gnl/Spiro4/437_TR241_c0_g1~~gnl/Spiro4/437_TR241_c0_g1_i1.p1  ORF type:complete len:360 (+),score=65.25 gnl/Spiro4/437_TR241_c0_g1_i1:45-1082(+)
MTARSVFLLFVAFVLGCEANTMRKIQGFVSDNIVSARNQMNRRDYAEWNRAVGTFKGNTFREHLCALFACREPGVHKVVLGADAIPDIYAAAVLEQEWGNVNFGPYATPASSGAAPVPDAKLPPVDGNVLYTGFPTKDVPFPVTSLMPAGTRDSNVPSVFERTAAKFGTPVVTQYIIVDHTITKFSGSTLATDEEFEIGVIPDKNNLCQLYIMTARDVTNVKKVPLLNNGVPIGVIFSWPIGLNYAYSNVCFDENWFWTGGEYDVNAHDSLRQRRSRVVSQTDAEGGEEGGAEPGSEPETQKEVRAGGVLLKPVHDSRMVWPPTFALYGGLNPDDDWAQTFDGRN